MESAQKQGEEFGQQFSRFLNCFGTERQKAAVEVLVRDHRSLQQSAMRFFMLFVEGMANNRYDLRNEASVKLAKAIMELPEAKKGLPLV